MSGSDTEIESDDDLLISNDPPSNSSNHTDDVDNEISLADAMTILTQADATRLPQDNVLLQQVHRASHKISTSLDLDGGKIFSSHHAPLFHPSFVTVLFRYRNAFQTMPRISSGAVCWVDIVLAKISEAVVQGASETVDALRPQRHKENIRGASQLPRSWDAIATVLVSQYASSAAKRVAIRLLYAVCVAGPALDFPDDNVKDLRIHIYKHLRQCVLQTASSGFRADYSSDSLVEQEQINLAILFTLFATSAQECATSKSGAWALNKPHTLSCMLDLLQAVILPEHVVEPKDIVSLTYESHSAQKIITTNDETMQWIWETWDDPRLANVEIITLVTAVYVRQLPAERLHTRFLGTQATSSAILRVFFHLVTYFAQYPLDIDDGLSLLTKCSLYILHLLKLEVVRTGPGIIRQRSDLCKTLLVVFVLLGSSPIVFRTQRVLLEVFTLFDSECLETAAKMAVEDTGDFLNGLNNFLGRDHDMEDIPACLIALNFCALLRRAGTPNLDGALSRSWAYLLPPVLESLPYMPIASLAPTLSSLLFLISTGTLEHRPQFSPKQNETLWRAAVGCGPSDLLAVAGIAVYVVSQDRVDLHLRKYGCRVWDTLRDALFLVLRHKFLDDEEPLALLTSSVICTAVGTLLRRLDSPFIVASPWTSTLRRELHSLLATEAHEEDSYRRILQMRIRASATRLLSAIENLNSMSDVSEVHLDRLEECRLQSVVSFKMSESVIVVPILSEELGRE